MPSLQPFRQTLPFFSLVLLFTFCGIICAQDSAESPYQIGFAKVEITPREPIRLSGYAARTKPTSDIADPLFARAMLLSPPDGELERSIVLVSTDSILITSAICEELSSWLQKKYSIGRSQLIVSATHSHAAPHLQGGLNNLFASELTQGESQAISRYREQFVAAIKSAITSAVQSRQSAKLSIGEASADFAVNRRLLRNGKWTGFGNQPEGVCDRRLRVMIAEDANAKLLGGAFMYACHCTTLGAIDKVSGDWAGLAASRLESIHEDAIFLPVIGCGADANPNPRGSYEMAQAYAAQIVDGVQAVFEHDDRVALPDFPDCHFGYAGIAPEQPSNERLKEMLASERPNERRWAEHMQRVKSEMGRLPETYPMPIHALKFGDTLSWIFLGGEVVVDYQFQIEKELPSEQTWVAAYTDDVFAYVASEAMRAEGGYEVDSSMIYYLQPGRWQTGTQSLILRRVREIWDGRQSSQAALSPEDGLAAIRVPNGFQVDLVASEPLVRDPINLAFAPDGSVWLVEMSDYPRGTEGGGQIKRLQDTDGDGRLDQASLFLSDLNYPTSVFPWRSGVLIIAAPDVLYAEDTDGDGYADHVQPLLSGIHEANPQHRACGFEVGLDGLLHLATGHGTKELFSHRNGLTYDVQGQDIAWAPDTGEVTVDGGATQFIRARDAFGNWFGNSNSKPIYQYVFERRYVESVRYRGPTEEHLLTPAVAPPVYPRSETPDRFNDLFALERFTSACSSTIVRVDGFGATTERTALICEPVHNLVARVRLDDSGEVFTAERFEEDQEFDFFTSTDLWSRPVRVINAPDGSVWIVDMMRQVIEHPEWIPTAWQERLNLRAGEQLGRIYRVYSGQQSKHEIKFIDAERNAMLKAFSHPNGAVRDLALLQLLWTDIDLEDELRTLYSSSPSAAVRASVVGALRAKHWLKPIDILQALDDSDPRVVVFGLKLAESWEESWPPELEQAFSSLALETNTPAVLLQFALSAAYLQKPLETQQLRLLLDASKGHPWVGRALSLNHELDGASQLIEMKLAEISQVPASAQEYESSFELIQPLWHALPAKERKQLLSRVAVRPPEEKKALTSADLVVLRLAAIEGSSQAKDALEPLIDRLMEAITSPKIEEEEKARLLMLLGTGLRPAAEEVALLERVLAEGAHGDVLDSVIAVSRRMQSMAMAKALVGHWDGFNATQKERACTSLTTHRDGVRVLVESLESGNIATQDLSLGTIQQLRRYSDRSLRTRCLKILGAPTERGHIVAEYLRQIPVPRDPQAGKELFLQHCAACHKPTDGSLAIGAPLENLKHWTIEQWLTGILNPNTNVEPKFLQSRFLTEDDEVLVGLVLTRDEEQLELALPDGSRRTLDTHEIVEERETKQSLMPEGFEEKLSPVQMAQLLAYLRGT